VVESSLEAEMDDHPGYGKRDPVGRHGGNSGSGRRPKTLLTEAGPVRVEVPRDRDGLFTPRILVLTAGFCAHDGVKFVQRNCG